MKDSQLSIRGRPVREGGQRHCLNSSMGGGEPKKARELGRESALLSVKHASTKGPNEHMTAFGGFHIGKDAL